MPPDPGMVVAAERLRAAWPPVFSVVVCPQPPALPDDITFDDLVAIDTKVSCVAIVQHYIELRPPEGTDCESRLVELLKKESWYAIRALRNWVLQAEQRVSVAELEAALKDGQAFIRSNRQEIQTGDPVEFGLRFYDDNLNRAAARDGIRCVWHFKQISNLGTKWRRLAKKQHLPIPKPAAPLPDTPEAKRARSST